MAKRFTDTNKYKKPFIRNLPGPYKLLWDYLYHDCDHAGIWIVDFEIAQIYIGSDMKISKSEALKFFNLEEPKIVEIDGGSKWFIPSFIEFQYGELNETNRAHNSVISILKKYNLFEKYKDLISPLKGARDMDKEMDMVMEEEQEEEKKEEIDYEKIIEVFNSLASNFPKVSKLTKQRKSAIHSRIKENDLESVGKVFKLAQESPFLNGENERGWRADFDWIMNPNNFIKILEGKYQNNKSNGKSTDKSQSFINNVRGMGQGIIEAERAGKLKIN